MPSLRDQLQPTVIHAIALHQQGRVAEAEGIYRRVLEQDPGNPDALHLLGLIAHHAGQYGPAVTLMQRAIASAPGLPLYHLNLAKVFRACGRMDDAIASARRGVELGPRFVDAHVELSASLRTARRSDDAEAAAREAVRLAPNHPEALSVLGNVLSDRNQIGEAIRLYESALRARPGWPEALSNLGEALRKIGRFDEAERYLRDAIRAAPNVAEPHFNLAMILLARGDYEHGWPEYEWRWRQIGVQPRTFAQPQWDGSDLAGKSIFLYAEQGFGDAIQFVRYASLVRERGANRVIVECDESLATLFQSADGVSDVIATGTAPPPFDVHCAIASLPYRCGTTLATIPNRVPYLHADSQRANRWREQLQLTDKQFNVGIVWSGRAHPNPNRSAHLRDLAPLAGVANLRCISLQLGPSRQQLMQAPMELKIDDPTESIKDFSDTAALMSALDLIISIDTATAHLAGALARRVWTIHPHVTDWRWLLNRNDSPWYPSMKLFRQPRPGDWQSVMQHVARELATIIRKR